MAEFVTVASTAERRPVRCMGRRSTWRRGLWPAWEELVRTYEVRVVDGEIQVDR